jgi:hypothetical protein
MKKTAVLAVALLSLATNLALAEGGYQAHNHEPSHDHSRYYNLVSAPEIDPGQATGALTLLGGVIAIIRGYRRKK